MILFIIIIITLIITLIYFNFNKIYNFFNQFKKLSLKEKIIFIFKIIFLIFFFFFGFFFFFFLINYLIDKNKNNFFFISNNVLNKKEQKIQILDKLKLFFEKTYGIVFNEKPLSNLALGDLNQFDKKLKFSFVKDEVFKKIKHYKLLNVLKERIEQNQLELNDLKEKEEDLIEKINKNNKFYYFNFLQKFVNKKNVNKLKSIKKSIQKANLLLEEEKELEAQKLSEINELFFKPKKAEIIDKDEQIKRFMSDDFYSLMQKMKSKSFNNQNRIYLDLTIKEKRSVLFNTLNHNQNVILAESYSKKVLESVPNFLNSLKLESPELYRFDPKFNYDNLVIAFDPIISIGKEISKIYNDLFVSSFQNYYRVEYKLIALRNRIADQANNVISLASAIAANHLLEPNEFVQLVERFPDQKKKIKELSLLYLKYFVYLKMILKDLEDIHKNLTYTIRCRIISNPTPSSLKGFEIQKFRFNALSRFQASLFHYNRIVRHSLDPRYPSFFNLSATSEYQSKDFLIINKFNEEQKKSAQQNASTTQVLYDFVQHHKDL